MINFKISSLTLIKALFPKILMKIIFMKSSKNHCFKVNNPRIYWRSLLNLSKITTKIRNCLFSKDKKSKWK